MTSIFDANMTNNKDKSINDKITEDTKEKSNNLNINEGKKL